MAVWCALHAADLNLGDAPLDGSAWCGPDGIEYDRNPRRYVTSGSQSMVTLWSLYRGGGMGAGLLPESGGTFDQPCMMLEAFGIMSQAADEFAPKRER